MKKGNWREEGGAVSGTSDIPNPKPKLADLQGWFYCIFSTYAVAHRFDDVIPTNWKGIRLLSVVGHVLYALFRPLLPRLLHILSNYHAIYFHFHHMVDVPEEINF